ncbi:Hcp family type VI secretion system effector [Pantoea sp. A4]|uniref:Hcp family type VI secretion system effector n=1 Tax=Pantoea sp. A4 TaxID=1225184 RepID=UPI00037D7364|nr:type VI secretion system tube protein Hcp [Pantoea sp. A4]
MNALYLQISHINGSSQDAQHSDWLDVMDYHWGGQRDKRFGGTVNFRNLRVNAMLDKATPPLVLHAAKGNPLSKVVLAACKAGGEQQEFYRITLEGARVVAFSLDETSEGTLAEYEFEADCFKIQYWDQRPDGGRAAEVRAGWNVKNNVSVF